LLLDSIDQREKTIVFCANQPHALLVRDLINQTKTSTSPDYCVRVTADDGKLGEQYLMRFQDNEKTLPTILTTSQKLSTGVDARNVRNIVLMRPVNSMIEFKQIIGRGTRLYDGKDYFTIYDFVKAHHKFNDADWDGEPVEPEAPTAKPLPPSWQPQDPTEPPKVREPGDERPAKLVVKLADGKTRSIQHITSTSYWGPDGKPLSPAQFLESLFGALPDFFKNEDELRTLWADPSTRKGLLNGLADKGFGRDPLREMQRIIDAEKSDLFDVLAYVAFALPTQTRAVRAERAKVHNAMTYGQKQQAFLAFVLDQYVTQGVDELDADKLTPLLKLRYNNALNDAMADLGDAVQVRQAFVGFQKYLYSVMKA
jgi:type I restriction enzyme R subunit